MKYLTLILLLTGIAISSGCSHYVYVNPRYPLIPRPERPKLVTGDPANLGKIMGYAKKLEIGVDEYNRMAIKKNKESKIYSD